MTPLSLKGCRHGWTKTVSSLDPLFMRKQFHSAKYCRKFISKLFFGVLELHWESFLHIFSQEQVLSILLCTYHLATIAQHNLLDYFLERKNLDYLCLLLPFYLIHHFHFESSVVKGWLKYAILLFFLLFVALPL